MLAGIASYGGDPTSGPRSTPHVDVLGNVPWFTRDSIPATGYQQEQLCGLWPGSLLTDRSGERYAPARASPHHPRFAGVLAYTIRHRAQRAVQVLAHCLQIRCL